jgi:lysophospholipase L1-like esterase
MRLLIATLALVAITGCSAGTKIALHSNLAAKALHSSNTTVIFMGDSITYNWGQSWASPDFATHPKWIDAGAVGNDSGQMVDRFQADVVQGHQWQGAQVVILAGTNDVYPGWVLCGNDEGPGYNDHNHDTCHNIAYMVQQAQANGITPILVTIPPWGCPDPNCQLAETADSSQARYTRINQLNAWIKAYAAQQGLVVVDYHSALVSVDGKTYVPDLTIDGVHPTPAGYDLTTPMVEDAITANEMK